MQSRSTDRLAALQRTPTARPVQALAGVRRAHHVLRYRYRVGVCDAAPATGGSRGGRECGPRRARLSDCNQQIAPSRCIRSGGRVGAGQTLMKA